MAGPRIFVATRDGLHRFDDRGTPSPVQHDGRSVLAIARRRQELWAVLDGIELWQAVDAQTWTRVGEMPEQRATCLVCTDDVFVGSSEARLFRLEDGGLAPVEPFDRVEGRPDWYTPWGGPPDTRSIAEWDDDLYVNVHVGGILRTSDRGATWTPTIDIDADVHQVTTADGLVLAACAGGLAASTDRGGTWTMRTDGLEARYSRAVTVCGDTVLVSASNGPRGGRAAVYRAELAGGAFERCRTGLPEWFDDNIDSHCMDAPPSGSFVAFGTSDGRAFASADAGATWEELAGGLPPVNGVLVIP